MTPPHEPRLSTVTTRRQFLGLSAAGVAVAAGVRSGIVASAPTTSPGPVQQAIGRGARFAYVGSFTSEARNARGEGLAVYRIDVTSGRWTRVQILAREVNPSFLALDPRRPVLYSVHAEANQVSAFAIDERSGEVTLLNRQSSGGDNPVHLALDPTGRFLVVANYGAGSVAVLSINADGSLGARTDLVSLTGEPGPHRTEQAVPHPHHCPFDPGGRFVVVPDKGLDRIFIFRLDGTKGTLVPVNPPSAKTRAGAGPRHAGFHPRLPYAYVINELDSTITTWRLGASGSLDAIQIVSSIPATFTGDNTGAAIAVAPSGRFVYGSNRGYDSIGVFRVDESSGLLSPIGWEPTRGATPRFIGLDPAGARLFAANQRGDSIVEFEVDQVTGALRATGQTVATGTPVCVLLR